MFRHREDLPSPILALLLFLVLILASLFFALPARGAGDAEIGRLRFTTYCASCHGAQAKGDGTLAEVLRVPPPDLTTLAERHDGVFPEAYVRRTIDGREEMLAHGRREMPVWGIGLRDLGRDSDQEAEIQARINDLVVFLRSIQTEH